MFDTTSIFDFTNRSYDWLLLLYYSPQNLLYRASSHGPPSAQDYKNNNTMEILQVTERRINCRREESDVINIHPLCSRVLLLLFSRVSSLFVPLANCRFMNFNCLIPPRTIDITVQILSESIEVL